MRVLPIGLALSALTLGLLYTPAIARANGRFPKAQAIVVPPPGGDEKTIYLRATFGILVSRDGGESWRWLCEKALGFASTWDPPIAATKDGRLWVALPDGARGTSDGCAVDDVPALAGELVTDLAVDGSGEGVLAVTSSPGRAAFAWRMDPRAPGTFTRLGKGIRGFRFDTIEVAPSSPSRVYLTATLEGNGPIAHIFRSDDGGATLKELSPKLAEDARLFVSAVDPRDADRIYVRALAATGSDVLLSTDGGKTLRSVLHMKGAMFGFARTADGSVLYAGGGDPAEGIWRSIDRGATWQPQAKTPVFCLNAEGPRLLVCSNPYLPGGYAVGESRDQGATVKALATFEDVVGPVLCDGGAAEAGALPPHEEGGEAGAATTCAASWPETRAQIATSTRMPKQSPAETPAVVDGGGTAPSRRGSACGCAAVGAPSRAPRSLFGAGLLAAFVAFRARRRDEKTRRRREGSWIPRAPEPRFHGPRSHAIVHPRANAGSFSTRREGRES